MKSRARVRVRPLSQLGVAFAVIACFTSFTPSLLPRAWDWQVWVTVTTVALTYALGVVLAWLAACAGAPRPARTARRLIWYGIAAAVVGVVPLSLWLGEQWQHDLRAGLGMPLQFSYSYLGIALVSAAVLTGALVVVRIVRVAGIRLARPMHPRLRRAMAVILVVASVGLLTAGFATGQVGRWIDATTDASSAANDAGTDSGISQPASPLRSGAAASLVSWQSLGRRGRTFVAGGPTAAQLERLTGRPALDPIRVYAGTASAPSFQAQADLVLAELKRTAAFDRAVIAVGVPAGDGGLDNELVAPLEYLFDGSTAVAAMQYSHLPSWVAFVGDQSPVQDSARTLFDTIHRYWSSLSPTHRPRLAIVGGSLGALGAANVFSGLPDLLDRTSAALMAGPPSSTPLWQQLTRNRVSGTPQRLPVYGDATTVRFAQSAADLRTADGKLRSPRLVFLQHATDPVVWWSPDLLWQPPQWLREARGPAVPDAMFWFPVATYMQLIGDLQKSLDPPAGFGHRYSTTDLVTAWAALLHPPNWTDAELSDLAAALR